MRKYNIMKSREWNTGGTAEGSTIRKTEEKCEKIQHKEERQKENTEKRKFN